MKTLEQVVSGKVNSLFVKKLITKNGWTKQDAAYYIVEFISGGTKENFKSFMESKQE